MVRWGWREGAGLEAVLEVDIFQHDERHPPAGRCRSYIDPGHVHVPAAVEPVHRSLRSR
ncbi:hypothetical protein ACFV98_34835 [Streptomyces violascens]|uniref:hypothetical protein n=1 Tax=Streptomyces violascens TaxID=67381 RepID=UPI00364A2F5A